MKIHFESFIKIDRRYPAGAQSEHDYLNQTLCGYVRENITRDASSVTCKMCLNGLRNLNNCGEELSNLHVRG